jgi:predicted RND superfamily exporter protein
MFKNDEILSIIMLIRQKVSNEPEIVTSLEKLYDLSKEVVEQENEPNLRKKLGEKFEKVARFLSYLFKQFNKKIVIKDEEQLFKEIIDILDKDF